jgi:NifU-like protein involved in Fe-S cluster formation
MWVTLLLSAVLALAIAAGCLLMVNRRRPRFRGAQGCARVESSCGSRLEMGLHLKDGRVARADVRAEGCAYNCTCLQAAARLARGKTLPEVLGIDAEAIVSRVGEIPDDHLHCAQAAARTLHAASQACRDNAPAAAVTRPSRASARNDR